MAEQETPGTVDQVLDMPDLAIALDSEHFKEFLDRLPVAIAVSRLTPVERVVYANMAFERLSGIGAASMLGGQWDRLPGESASHEGGGLLDRAIAEGRDYLGSFTMAQRDGALVDVWANVIEDDAGQPVFRLVALVEAASRDSTILDELEAQVREKDTQLLELQHRVRNNLQMITALIRMEARGVADMSTGQGFDRLAGRVEALGLLYRALEASGPKGAVDLGIFLSEIASAVMRAHATEGIHLDLQVDTWLVSLNVAMPAGLVVNELLTNALKHAFEGRNGGKITLHSITEAPSCRLLIADDGVGLPEGAVWPRQGKLSALIVRSLIQNAGAKVQVESAPGAGVTVTITLTAPDLDRPKASPEPSAPASE
jgi:two-component sensor histidine kinase